VDVTSTDAANTLSVECAETELTPPIFADPIVISAFRT